MYKCNNTNNNKTCIIITTITAQTTPQPQTPPLQNQFSPKHSSPNTNAVRNSVKAVSV